MFLKIENGRQESNYNPCTMRICIQINWAHSFGRALKFTRLSPVDSEIITKALQLAASQETAVPFLQPQFPKNSTPTHTAQKSGYECSCSVLLTDKGQLCSHKICLFYSQTFFIKTLMPTEDLLNVGTHWPIPTLATLSLRRWALVPKEILFF